MSWVAPPYWTPPAPAPAGRTPGAIQASAQGMTAQAESLPSQPLPFTAITPCRVADTRGNGFTGAYGPPMIGSGTSRDVPIAGQCGIPASAVAVSFNFTILSIATSGDLRVYPTGGTMPLVSTQNWTAATGVVANAAVTPLGGGSVTVHVDGLGAIDLVIDVNGYYGPSSVVTSLNTLTGGVTLAAGSNVTITPSGNTLTVAATGGVLPTGIAGQTLANNGSAWTASSVLTNDGTNVGVANNLLLPNTASGGTSGVIELGGNPFVHNYGTRNTFVGQNAGNFSTSGGSDTGTGYSSLSGLTVGQQNTADGAYSLSADSSGSANTAVGAFGLESNSTGFDNTATGASAMTANTTGYSNTATGASSLSANTIGAANTAIGYQSLWFNTSASQNTAVGSGALTSQSFSPGNQWNSDNTAVGFDALTANQPDFVLDGIENAAVGSQALLANTTGSDDTAVGYQSLVATTNGSDNTAVGWKAGATNTAGQWNTFVGSGADATATGLLDATAIGYGAKVNSSYKVRIGDGSVTVIEGEVGWSYPSDERLKEDIRGLDLGLDFVMRLRPVSFRMKQGDGRTDMGFIAQDIEALLGGGYNVVQVGDDPQHTLSLRGTDLIAPLVKAVQEQEATIERQQAEIAAQDTAIDTLEARLEADDALRTRVDELAREVGSLLAERESGRTAQASTR